MPNTDARLRLRAALSHRDKAKLSIQECAQAFASGSITKARHDSLFEFYTGHLRSAEQEIAAGRADQRKQLESLQAKLTAALDSQFTISERASTGILSAPKANAKNRQLTTDIAHYRAAITDCASLISANTPGELGGFIDLSLDQYARPDLDQPAPVTTLERAAIYLLPIVLLFTAFLPWLKLANAIGPLFDIASVLAAAGITPEPAPPIVRYIWLPFVLIPLLAYPISMARDHQNAGWGLVLTGLLAVSAVLAPIAALSTNPGSPVTFSEIVAGLQFGAFGYLVGGLALALLGARRLRRNQTIAERKSRGGVLIASVALVILLAGAVVFLLTPKPFAVVFEARQPDPATGQIGFSCRNLGPTPIVVYVPWPEEGARGVSGQQVTYGVSLYVQPENSQEFRLFALSQDFWVKGGVPFPENRAFHVESQHVLELALDGKRIQNLGTPIQRIRFVVSRADGQTAYTFDSDPLPSHYATTAQPKKPATPGEAEKTPAQPTPGAETQAATPAPEPVVDTISVRYLGMVAGKAALSVARSATERPKNVSVGAGDTVEDAWTLKEIIAQPPSVQLVNERTGKNVTIRRGATEALPRGRQP